MNLRMLAARVAAALLVMAWLAVAGGFLVARPPASFVDWLPVAAAILATALAALTLAMPTVGSAARPERVAIVGLVAALPLTIGLLTLLDGGAAAPARPLTVPAAHVWAWIAAIAATGFVALLALGPHRHRLWPAGALTLAACVGVVAWPVTAASPVAVAGCAVPTAAGAGRIEVSAQAVIDGRTVGMAELSGERSGADERWTGRSTGVVDGGVIAVEFARFDGRAVLRQGASADWLPVDGGTATLDNRVVATIARVHAPSVEDIGVEMDGDAAVRHCRLLIDGNTALEAFLPAAWLLGAQPLDVPQTLSVWRGELDWWADPAGVLVRAAARVGGHPADAWDSRGLRGEVRAVLAVTERSPTRQIEQPLP